MEQREFAETMCLLMMEWGFEAGKSIGVEYFPNKLIILKE